MAATSPTFGERAADAVARTIGSWRFIICQSIFLVLWISINGKVIFDHGFTPWDKPPFILLNLMLSFQAAFTGPILQMTSNRSDQIATERKMNQLATMLATMYAVRDLVSAVRHDLDEQEELLKQLGGEGAAPPGKEES